MATTEEKQRIKELVAKGKSINTIKDKLELPKSTVYYHFEKEVGQKQKENRLKIPKDEEVKGEICGIFAGDGYFKKYENGHHTTVITLNHKQNYWKNVRDFFSEELGKKPHKLRQDSRARLKYDSKRLGEFLKKNLYWEEKDKTATVRLRNKNQPEEFSKGFLRGLIGTDGTLKKQRNYIFSTISKDLAEDITELLTALEIKSKIRESEDKRKNYRNIFRVTLPSTEAEKFQNTVKPRHPKKKLEYT